MLLSALSAVLLLLPVSKGSCYQGMQFHSLIQRSYYDCFALSSSLYINNDIELIEDLAVVEPLSLLTKESLYCFRSPNMLTSGACTVECKRIDQKPLGWGMKNGITNLDDSDNCRRRCFAFTTTASTTAADGKNKYEGPLLVHVREIPFSYGKLGGSIWLSSIGMSQYFAMNPSLVQNKRILELGSGVGLLGITISKLGAAHVTLSEYGSPHGVVNGEITDYKDDNKRLIPSAMLTNLQFNANLNAQHQNDIDNDNADSNIIAIQHIDWYDYLPENKTRKMTDDFDDDNTNSSYYDLIVGSDLINWEDDVEALIATLKHFMTRATTATTHALLSSQIENRKGLPLFLKRLGEAFSSVETEEYYVQHYDTQPIMLIKISL